MEGSHMNLLFPQWQGAGHGKALHEGAMAIHNAFLQQIPCETVNICENEQLQTENGILGYEEVLEQLKNACLLIDKVKPDTIFTIGGDCGVELAPVSYLNKKFKGELAIIWFDAHGDLNTPASSPSKRFHGMPLRALLGEGDKEIVGQCFSKLSAEQLVMVGTRELDSPEAEYIKESGIVTIPVATLEDCGILLEQLKKKGFSNVYIHIDLDVLEPQEFPCVMCPTPEGLPMDKLIELVREIKACFNLVGFSMVEFSPADRNSVYKLERLVKLGTIL